MTPQLTQAIKLLTLSNMELEAAIAEEVAKNPLLEMRAARMTATGLLPPNVSADASDGPDDDRPLDYDFDGAALENDSFTDVTIASGDGEGFDFDRLEACETSLCEHLMAQMHGASGPTALLAQIIIQQLDENGYLTVPLAQVAADAGRRPRRGGAGAGAGAVARPGRRRRARAWRNASRCRPRPPTATIRRWRG